MKNVFQVLLLISVVVMGYIAVDSPFQKIRFEKEKEHRTTEVVNRLIDIRTAQVAYKEKFGTYCASFDTLIDFVKFDSVPLVYKEGFLTDSMIEAGMTELKAIKLGIIIRDTIFKPVGEEIFPKGFNADSIRYVPTVEGFEFELGASEVITQSGVNIQVFEAKTPYEVYLAGLDKQEIHNMSVFALKYDRYAGLMVGSLQEANNNAGNWE